MKIKVSIICYKMDGVNTYYITMTGGSRSFMKPPRIPLLIVDIIQNALLSCDGMFFDTREACPSCGGKLSGYDTKKKQFAVMLEGNIRHPVHVQVKRFSCRKCKKVCFADEPFYPGTRIGSPVVDLCRTLTAGMSLYRATTFMQHLGIIVERGTVRNYAQGSFPGNSDYGPLRASSSHVGHLTL